MYQKLLQLNKMRHCSISHYRFMSLNYPHIEQFAQKRQRKTSDIRTV